MKRLLKEFGTLAYTIFIFFVMIGIFTYSSVNSALIFSKTRVIHLSMIIKMAFYSVRPFFLVVGNGAYLMIIPLFFSLLGMIFKKQYLYKMSLWVFVNILLISCLYGIYSFSDEVPQGGILGSIISDFFVPLFGKLFVSLLIAVLSAMTIIQFIPFIYKGFDTLLIHLMHSVFNHKDYLKNFDSQEADQPRQESLAQKNYTDFYEMMFDSIQDKDHDIERVIHFYDQMNDNSQEQEKIQKEDHILENMNQKIEELLLYKTSIVSQINDESPPEKLLKNESLLTKESSIAESIKKDVNNHEYHLQYYAIEDQLKNNPYYASDILQIQKNTEENKNEMIHNLVQNLYDQQLQLEQRIENFSSELIIFSEQKAYKESVIDFPSEDIQYQDDEEKIQSSYSEITTVAALENLEKENIKESLHFVEDQTFETSQNVSEYLCSWDESEWDSSVESESITDEEINQAEFPLNMIPPEEKNIFDLPSPNLLNTSGFDNEIIMDEEIQNNITIILRTLKEFNIHAELEDAIVGPVVTRYEIKPPKGLKVNKIIDLADNIALGLATKERVRIEAPVYGKSVVGIEVANSSRQLISFKDLLMCFQKEDIQKELHIPFILGKSIDGTPIIKDITKMPHLLIAGSTGSGKSVCINTIVNSILFYKNPDEVKMLLVDPKRVELILYDDLPHLISPVIKDTQGAIRALKWLVLHMEERYTILEKERSRNIQEYNIRQEKEGLEKMPYLVAIMDEFADLILLGKREVEESVIRLAAMARAVGIHLILATQRPSADVITGLIKANFPSRIAFRVSAKMESRIILDENGAESLLGKGDMLFTSAEFAGISQRIQAPFISDQEIQNVTDFFRAHYSPQYWDEVLDFDTVEEVSYDSEEEGDDELFSEAVQIVIQDQKTSASYLQRRLKIGYNRAARLIEMMEERGILSKSIGNRPRVVLVNDWN